MANRSASRRRFLAVAGLAALGGCGTGADPDGDGRETTTRTPTGTRVTTGTPTRTATRTPSPSPTPRPRPRFEGGPATCTVAGIDPAEKSWPHAGYDGEATRNPPAANAPNGFPTRTAWTVPTTGPGPVLVDGRRYYLRTATSLLALDPADGRVRWRHRAPGPAGGVAVDDVVALPAQDGTLRALDPAEGRERWRVDAGTVATTPPVLTPDAVVLGTETGVRGYARDDGTACFRVPTADPVARLVRAGDLFVAATARDADGTLVALDPGRETVRYTRYLAAPPTGLLAADDALVVGVGGRTLGLVPGDGTPRWTAPVGPVLATGRHRYALGADELVALDGRGEAAWRAAVPAPTGVVATDDLVVVTGGTGEAALQVHDARTGRRRLRQRDAGGYREPVVADDRVLVGGTERTHVFEETTF